MGKCESHPRPFPYFTRTELTTAPPFFFLRQWGLIFRQEGLRGIFTGWSPTFLGYSAQGAFKYGWYEYFKKTYSDLAGPENAHRYKTALYLSASASAEFLADLALCPFEAVKVRMQTTIPPPYTGTLDGISKITAAEGFGGLYKGLYPLWGRQIPYTMMKVSKKKQKHVPLFPDKNPSCGYYAPQKPGRNSRQREKKQNWLTPEPNLVRPPPFP